MYNSENSAFIIISTARVITLKTTKEPIYSFQDCSIFSFPTLRYLVYTALLSNVGDPAEGKTLLNGMRDLFDMKEPGELAEWEQFNDFYDLVRTVQDSGRTVAQLTEPEIDEMLLIAQAPNSGRAGNRAWNTLCFHYGICPEGQLPPTPRSYEAYTAQHPNAVSAYKAVEAYPNPANEYATLKYELFKAHPNTSIVVFDTDGRQLTSFGIGEKYEGQVLWDTRGVNPGIYFYQLWQNNKKVSSGKIVIQH